MTEMEAVDPRIVARAENLNPKSFPVGSVVYFLKNKKSSSEKYIEFGTVIEHYASEIEIQLYEMRDTRTINGVPVKEFETPTPWKKLPKGWTWNTRLFTIGTQIPDELVDDYCSTYYNRKDPQVILKAIRDGAFVKVSENDHATFRSEIDSKQGWRIVREYDGWYMDCWSVPFYHCYATWEEAQAELDAILAENQRQAALSDLEWSIEQIDHTLDKWAYLYAVPDDRKQQMRNRILALDNLDDVVIRLSAGGIEWKYDRNRRWKRMELL